MRPYDTSVEQGRHVPGREPAGTGITVRAGDASRWASQDVLPKQMMWVWAANFGIQQGGTLAYIKLLPAALGALSFTKGKARWTELTPPLSVTGHTFWQYEILVDGSIVGQCDPVSRTPDWARGQRSAMWRDPKTKEWREYPGLFVYASSPDGRYIAYSEPPYKELRLAKVAEQK